MDNKYGVIDTLSNYVVFTGTLEECKKYIKENDNGFLTLIP